jgi:conjugative relaxase-like TrwC/TraI family protein
MLTVAKVTSGQATGYAAYLDGRTQAPELGDYYLKDGERVEAPGRWVGGAQVVGGDPAQAVSGDQLRALMSVRHPDTGLPLRRVGGNGEAVSAIDATFSAPKSVSAIWALASPELRAQLESAHEHAVDRALAYATQRVQMIRQRVDSKRVIHTNAARVIATSWRHTTARAVHDRPPDPQLHSHLLLHGAIRRDGEIVAIDSRAWYVHRRELGAAYRTELAHQLTQLGFAIQRGTGQGARYFEIAGIPAGLIDRWSSRHREVQLAIEARLADKHAALKAAADRGDNPEAAAALQAFERSGRLMPAEERYLTSSTRAPKTLATHGDLDQHWYDTAHPYGLDSRTVERLRNLPQELEAASDRQLSERLTEFDATFADREARAVALEASAGVPIESALRRLDCLQTTGQLLRLADGRQTTRSHRASEKATVAVAGRIAAARVTPLPAKELERQRLALDAELKANGGQLSDEQQHALQLGCADRQLVMIEGQAGTGKSTTLSAVARAHYTHGQQLAVTSTGALAAQHLATELEHAGVPAAAYSTASLHAAITNGTLTLTPDTTVIHDEAALASTREQHQLLSAVETSGARLILVGDPRQSQAVGAGGLWQDLERHARHNDAHVQLTAIVRAHDPADRRDQTLFRSGQAERALAGYYDRGRVHLAADQRQAEDHALDAAHADRRAGRRTTVIAQTSNEHLDQLNARAQAIRAQDGELRDHTMPLTGRPYGLRAGDHVQLRQALVHPQLGRIPNGTTVTVDHVTANQREATLRLADGRTAGFTQGQADQASVRLAYVQHPFPAQGQTTDTTHLLVLEHATQEGCYVALTRARQQTHIHAPHPQQHADQAQLTIWQDQDPLAVLAERMSASEPEIASIRTSLAHEHQLACQHTQEHHDPWVTPQPERASDRQPPSERIPEPDPEPTRDREADRARQQAERLDQSRVRLADAERVLAHIFRLERDHAQARRQADQAAASLTSEQRRAELLRQGLDELGPIGRLRYRGRELKGLLAGAQENLPGLRDRYQRLCEHADRHQAILDRYRAQHPNPQERLQHAEQELDQVVDQEARRRLEHPGPHLTCALGPAPNPLSRQQETWRRAALQIERYRTRYQIDPSERAALGPEPEAGHRRQREDRELAEAQALYARTQLAQPPIEQALTQEHLHHAPAARRQPPTLGRDGPSLGIGL